MSGALGIVLRAHGTRLEAQISAPAPLPVAGMMLGKPLNEVADLLPRLFNLCGAAQGAAFRLSAGLPDVGPDAGREILRDHLAKLFVIWPRMMGLAARALPSGWQAGAPVCDAVWGGEKPVDLTDWMAQGSGVAPIFAALAARFAPFEAAADVPAVADFLVPEAGENSAALRVARDGLMAQAEARFGRGPLWRALARAVEVGAPLPPSQLRGDGTAICAAARGSYALRVAARDGILTGLTRVTPTDHLLAKGGVLAQSLARLPAAKIALAPLVVDILDPCVPVVFGGAADA